MKRIAVLATLLIALPVSADSVWWTPAPPTAVWWMPEPPTVDATKNNACPCGSNCQCQVCDCDKTLTYAAAYDLGKSTHLPVVVFNQVPCRDVAVRGEWEPLVSVTNNDGKEWKRGVMLARYLAGAWHVNWLSPNVTVADLRKADDKLCTGHDCPKLLTDAASGAAAAVLIGLTSPEFDVPQQPAVCFGPDCQSAAAFRFAGNSAPAAFMGGGTGFTTFTTSEPVFVATRVRGPFRRLAAAIRSARAARFSFVPMQQVSFIPQAQAAPTTFTRYEWTPVETYKLEAITESVPVTRYQWVPQSSKKPDMPAKSKG